MAKRSTTDQTLVRKIYETLKQAGDEVIESDQQRERGVTAKREIDLVLVRTVFGVRISIAVEVRGRGRKATVQWLDELAGKYGRMNVQKIIAVSTAGFTKAALEKAAEYNIETLMLSEALGVDWPAQFTKVGVVRIVRHDRLESMHLVTHPFLEIELKLDFLIGSETEGTNTLEKVAGEIYKSQQDALSKKLSGMLHSMTVEDLSKMALSEISVAFPDPIYLHLPDRSKKQILQLTIRMISQFSFDILPMRHHLLGQPPLAVASTTSFPQLDGEKIFTFVQVAEHPNQIHVSRSGNATCRHCGALNAFPGFAAVKAYVCRECGEGVVEQ